MEEHAAIVERARARFPSCPLAVALRLSLLIGGNAQGTERERKGNGKGTIWNCDDGHYEGTDRERSGNGKGTERSLSGSGTLPAILDPKKEEEEKKKEEEEATSSEHAVEPADLPGPDRRSEARRVAALCLGRINALKGTRYQTKGTAFGTIVTTIAARMGEGHTEADFLAVIEDRWKRWSGEAKSREWVRPSTLFRPSHFAEYLAEARASGPAAASPDPMAGLTGEEKVAAICAKIEANRAAERQRKAEEAERQKPIDALKGIMGW